MKKTWLYSVRLYVKIGLFFYFKSIVLKGKNNIPKNKPVLFLANHQNALLDALLIATQSGRTCYFLTRASVFKKPMVSRLLKSLNMLPVYRVRDGWNTITKNRSIFSKSVTLLYGNNTIAVFPEGNHNLARRVRSLSKGFTRIILEIKDRYPTTNLYLIPIGLNYQAPKQMGSCVSLYYGNAIESSSYNMLNNTEAITKIKNDVFESLSKLTTQIPEDNYDTILKQLIRLRVDFTNPEAVNQCVNSGFNNCKTAKKSTMILKKVLKPLVFILLCVPVLIWKIVIKPKIKEDEFVSTFRFAVCITLVPLWLFILFVIVICCFGMALALVSFITSLLLLLAYNKV